MKITRKSDYSGIERTKDLPITDEEWKKWDNGNGCFIQHAFPNLSISDREFILTGMTDEEWDEAFPEDEEDYQDDISLAIEQDRDDNEKLP